MRLVNKRPVILDEFRLARLARRRTLPDGSNGGDVLGITSCCNEAIDWNVYNPLVHARLERLQYERKQEAIALSSFRGQMRASTRLASQSKKKQECVVLWNQSWPWSKATLKLENLNMSSVFKSHAMSLSEQGLCLKLFTFAVTRNVQRKIDALQCL